MQIGVDAVLTQDLDQLVQLGSAGHADSDVVQAYAAFTEPITCCGSWQGRPEYQPVAVADPQP
jgi:hypothetical protein